MVHYFGSIIIPAHDTIQFWLASDDGGTIKIGVDEWGSWQDQGCSATESGFLDLDAGIHSLDGWFYEAGGGTCWMLAWQIDDEPWQIVPDEAFIANRESWSSTTVQTTTTSVPETTVVETTVVSVQTSIYTSTSVTTTLPATTTSVTVEQTTTTTEPEPQPVQQQPVWVEPEPTIEPATEDTEPSPVVTEPVEEVTVETYPDFPDVVDEVIVDDTVADYIITEDSQLEEVVVEDTVVDILDKAELEVILEDVETITEDEAVAVAQDAEFVESLSPSQAVAVFDAVVVSELSEEQIDAIVEAVQDAPTEVRAAFEQEINIFAEGFDEYVPLGSNVPVSTRKTLIAVAAGTAAVASSSRRNK